MRAARCRCAQPLPGSWTSRKANAVRLDFFHAPSPAYARDGPRTTGRRATCQMSKTVPCCARSWARRQRCSQRRASCASEAKRASHTTRGGSTSSVRLPSTLLALRRSKPPASQEYATVNVDHGKKVPVTESRKMGALSCFSLPMPGLRRPSRRVRERTPPPIGAISAIVAVPRRASLRSI